MSKVTEMKSDEFIVEYEGKKVFMLNKQLMEKQDCLENLETIKAKHVERLGIHEKMKKTRSKESLHLLDIQYTQVEFDLQELWKFRKDRKFHRFWNRPQCGCPTMDNEDAYPTGYYVISGGCKIHGGVNNANQ